MAITWVFRRDMSRLYAGAGWNAAPTSAKWREHFQQELFEAISQFPGQTLTLVTLSHESSLLRPAGAVKISDVNFFYILTRVRSLLGVGQSVFWVPAGWATGAGRARGAGTGVGPAPTILPYHNAARLHK